jgi:CubicO group peptidase (beta-lactamase class C family)
MSGLDVEPLRSAARCAVVGSSVGGVRRQVSVGSGGIDTPFRIASLTKPFTAVGTVLAARRHGVGLDLPVLDVLPGLRGDWAADRRLTIGEILSQTSGLAATVTAADVLRLGGSDAVALEAARLVVRAGSARQPGVRWEYYNGNYFLAGAVIAALTGVGYEDALDDLVVGPWGLRSTSFRPPTDLVPGVEHGRPVPSSPYPRGRRPSGGLCSTAGDLLTFGEHLLDHPDLLAQVRTAWTRPDDAMRYGLGWAIGPSGQLYLNGRLPGYRTALVLVPDHHLVAVGLAADSEALPALAGILNAVQHGLTGDDLAEAIDAFAA